MSPPDWLSCLCQSLLSTARRKQGCIHLPSRFACTRVKVFELAPPMTRTPLFAKDMRAQDGVRMMAVDEMVRRTIRGLKNDRLEIRPGMSNVLKLMSRL